MPVDVQDIDCDWYVITGHKVYGPSGIGVLYGKKDALGHAAVPGRRRDDRRCDAKTTSPTTIRRTASRPAPRRSCRRSVWAMRSTTWKSSAARRSRRMRPISAPMRMNNSRRINALRMIGNAPGKGAIFAFEMEGIHAHDVSMLIDRSGVAVRAGTHCAQPLLKRFGATSTCRASIRHVQYACGNRCAGRGAGKGAGVFLLDLV
jgi:cysteine desulfurase/selenocysteine lyase